MIVFVIGITGGVGGLLADRLLARGDVVRGLVRRPEQRDHLAARGVDATVGDLTAMGPDELARAVEGADVVVYSAGSNGGSRAATRALDGDGVSTAIKAARTAGVSRFALVSVMPDAWRERRLSEDEDYYFAVKKAADVELSSSDLDWLVLRPSLLVDEPGRGTVALGPAQLHDRIARADVAETLAALLHEPRTSRRILEVTDGPTPISRAVSTLTAHD